MSQPVPPWNEFRGDFESALLFAAQLHATQFRKETEIPYISHLMAVAGLVLENGGGRDESIAALLHDSIEDQAERYPGGASALRSAIRNKFGLGVLGIVEACTDADVFPKPEWVERKKAYISHLNAASAGALLVSCSDKLHNARAIVSDLRVLGLALWSRFNGGREGSLWYYRALADAFLRLGPQRLAEELDRTVREMERLGQ